jgi:hypothetical protein
MREEGLRELLETLQPYLRPAPYGPRSLSLNMGLHFTGGEPFLNFDLLRRAVEIATELEIPSLFVETNGFWGRNEQRARTMLRELKEAGLVRLLISVNPFFLEYVPFEATDTAIQVAHEVFGRHLMVYQLDYYARFKELGITGTMPFGEYLEREGREQTFGHTEFFLNGRSPFRMEEFGIFPHRPAREWAKEPCVPQFLRPWHNHFDNYGNFVPGYCGGISLGDWYDIPTMVSEGIELDERPVLDHIIRDDFPGLLELARRYGYREREEGYLSKCHLCADIRRHLVHAATEAGESFSELAPAEFYQQL